MRALSLAIILGSTACASQRGTIGAVIAQKEDGRLFLRDLPKGLASDRARLKPDDEILLIDGRDVRTMSSDEVHQALSGEVGSAVKLTLLRGEAVLRVTLKRTPAEKYRGPEASAPAR